MHGYGLIESPIARTLELFGTHTRADQAQMRVERSQATPSEALEYLSRLTFPATRLALLDRGAWTAVLTNSRNGSDFNDHQGWAARLLASRTIRVVDAEARWWRRGNVRERLTYEARIFELHGPDGSTIRSIACADDGGRWVFETTGEPFPIEASFAYDAARKKDRFTRDNLHDLLKAIGPGPLTEPAVLTAPRCALLSERILNKAWRTRVDAAACSLEEADDPGFRYYQRGMGWVPHMRTHAPSVIADFERAVELNPTLEPRVRSHLREAHRIVDGE